MRVQVGKVGRPHGLEGAFVVEEASDDPDRFAVGVTLVVDGERLVGRLDREVTRGAPIEVERSALPETEEHEYYAFQLVGLEVEETGGRKLGRVTEVSTGPANDVLELDTGLALPLVDACVREVDLDAGRILVEPGFSADS